MENEERQAIHPTALDEQEAVMTDEFLQQYEWQDADIEGNWLDPKERYTRPWYTLSYNGVPFAPLGGLHGLTGQPGHGKTFTFTQLMVAILKGEFYGLKYELGIEIPSPKVLYIDTEMEKGNTQLVMLRVYEMMGWQEGSVHDDFRILWLREEVQSADRWRKVLKAIQVMRPTVVFLDGLIDVIGDFNDNKECQEIIYACMATASHYGISLWCLLHENPGTTKMVGHAGSFLERKATDVLKTRKDKESGRVSFTVSQNKARARDLDDWTFHIEDGDNAYGRPVIESPATDVSSTAQINFEIEQVQDWMSQVELKVQSPASAGEIKEALKEVTGFTHNDTLNAITKMAKNRRFIVAQSKGEWEAGQKAPKWKFDLPPF